MKKDPASNGRPKKGSARKGSAGNGAFKKGPGNKGKSAGPSRPDVEKMVYLGFEIFYGKNNRQNDYLTMKIARGEDVWLHTKDIPGSHVLIKNNAGQPLPDEVLEKAAGLAAWHSQGREAAKVPVDFTRRKHVWKPGGARPGMVLYDHQQTLYVTPVSPVNIDAPN